MSQAAGRLLMDLAESWSMLGGMTHLTTLRIPGDVITRLSDEQRQLLKELKPEDIAGIRLDHVVLNNGYLSAGIRGD